MSPDLSPLACTSKAIGGSYFICKDFVIDETRKHATSGLPTLSDMHSRPPTTRWPRIQLCNFMRRLQSLAASPSADVVTTNNGTVVLSLAPPLQIDSDGIIRLVPDSVTEVGDLSSGSIGRGFGECFTCSQACMHGWHELQQPFFALEHYSHCW